MRCPLWVSQVSAELGVGLPLIAHVLSVDVATSVHLQHMAKFMHDDTLSFGSPRRERQKAMMKLAARVRTLMTYRFDSLLVVCALVSPSRISWMWMEASVADEDIQLPSEPVVAPVRSLVGCHKEVWGSTVAEERPALLKPAQQLRRCSGGSLR